MTDRSKAVGMILPPSCKRTEPFTVRLDRPSIPLFMVALTGKDHLVVAGLRAITRCRSELARSNAQCDVDRTGHETVQI